MAAGVVGGGSAAIAQMAMNMPAGFGPVYEMKMHGHMRGHVMHMQVLQNKAGQKFVVVPMSEAEQVFGPVHFGAHPFNENDL